jgi:ATP-dependent RNA helicase DeaD
MVQKQREQMVERLKRGTLDILVATDVAARGLEVERISHVINFDIPYDNEAYIHRIGRTGRAGRRGDAILFVSPRERRMLNAIEKATRQKIEPLELPSSEMVNNKRIADFKQRISDTIAAGELEFMQGLLEQYQREHDIPALEIAAALAKLSMGDRPLLLEPDREKPKSRDTKAKQRKSAKDGGKRQPKPEAAGGMERFRIEVGHRHNVKPGNIVGAIANEAGLDAEYIGHIDIHEDFTLVDLPLGMPNDIYRDLKRAWVCGQRMNITRLQQTDKGKKAPRKAKKQRKPG